LTDCSRYGEVVHTGQGTNILHTTNRWKAISIWSHRNCLLKHLAEGKIECLIEVSTRRGRRSKPLLDELKERRRYCKLNEETLDCTLWSTPVGRGYEPLIRPTAE